MLGPKVAFWHCDTLLSEERELVKVATLKDDLVVAHMEEAAATQTLWITPFKDCPFSILKDVLHDASHGRSPELDLEHVPDSLPAMQRLHHNLVIGRVRRVEGCEALYIALIEATHPLLDELFR